MKVALLDVNVLLALMWPNHQHHGIAADWFLKNHSKGWATCAFTEAGFIRLSCNPAYTPQPSIPLEAAEVLDELRALKGHHFLAEAPSLTTAAGLKVLEQARSHQQVTDAYLVNTARHHRAVLVTFDGGVLELKPAVGTVLVLR